MMKKKNGDINFSDAKLKDAIIQASTKRIVKLSLSKPESDSMYESEADSSNSSKNPTQSNETLNNKTT